MNCSKCGGQMVPRLIRICACEASPPTIVENVPALVCSLCGDREISDQTVGTLEHMRNGTIPSRPVRARVFDFAMTQRRRAGNGNGQADVVVGLGTSEGSPLTGLAGTHADPVYA